MGIATILHWDKFNHQHAAFWLWTVLYASTPFIVPLVWWRNQLAVAGESLPDGEWIPRVAQVVIGLLAAGGLAASFLFFVLPEVMIKIWPWTLTQLTSRVLGTEFLLFGVFGVMMLRDGRWDTMKLPLSLQLASPIFFLGATIISRRDFDWSNPLAWVFVFNIVFLFVLGIPGLYVYMEFWRRRNSLS